MRVCSRLRLYFKFHAHWGHRWERSGHCCMRTLSHQGGTTHWPCFQCPAFCNGLHIVALTGSQKSGLSPYASLPMRAVILSKWTSCFLPSRLITNICRRVGPRAQALCESKVTRHAEGHTRAIKRACMLAAHLGLELVRHFVLGRPEGVSRALRLAGAPLA